MKVFGTISQTLMKVFAAALISVVVDPLAFESIATFTFEETPVTVKTPSTYVPNSTVNSTFSGKLGGLPLHVSGAPILSQKSVLNRNTRGGLLSARINGRHSKQG